MIKVGSQFSGVGAFDAALERLGIPYENEYAAEWDKYARQTYLLNFKEPNVYVKDVHDTPIEKIPQLDIFMSSPPCQSFSIAGKMLGENDSRGILIYQTHRFVQINKPRYFIIENVKGLLSDDSGRTFNKWLEMFGGKSINNKTIMFPYPDSVPYHVYYQVLNAKNYGVPQNRERVFIVGIRDDADNNFSFPKPFKLTKRLKDILEDNVDEKYYLSDKRIKTLFYSSSGINSTFPPAKSITASTITARCHKQGRSDNYIELEQVASLYENNSDAGRIYSDNGISCTIKSEGGGLGAKTGLYEVMQVNPSKESGGVQSYQQNRVYDANGIMVALDTDSGNRNILINTNNSKGYDILAEGDSLNYSVPTSETRRGRVGKQVAQTIDTQCNQSTMVNRRIRRLTEREAFRLMDFPDSFIWNCSGTQAYKQTGNSIVVSCLTGIIKNLKLKSLLVIE